MSKVCVSNYEYFDTKPGDKGYSYQKIDLSFEPSAESAVLVDIREIALTECSRSGLTAIRLKIEQNQLVGVTE